MSEYKTERLGGLWGWSEQVHKGGGLPCMASWKTEESSAVTCEKLTSVRQLYVSACV